MDAKTLNITLGSVIVILLISWVISYMTRKKKEKERACKIEAALRDAALKGMTVSELYNIDYYVPAKEGILNQIGCEPFWA